MCRLFAVELVALTSALALSGPAAAGHRGALDLYPPDEWSVQSLVDNFDPANNATFSQRVLSYSRWWRHGGPILLYLGNEASVENFYNYTGAIFEHAEALRALVVFIEHRFYGRSLPHKHGFHGLSVDQALADFAWFVPEMKRRFQCEACPVITFGGSYGGMLVAWFRQRYPQLTLGGIAAGAPVDFYPGDGREMVFWNATLHTFRAFGTPGCDAVIADGLDAVRRVAATAAGRGELSRKLGSCDELEGEETAGAKAEFFLKGVLASLAMLDYPEPSNFTSSLPANPVLHACDRMQATADRLAGFRAVVDLYLNGSHGFTCYDYLAEPVGRPTLGHLRGPSVAPDMGPWQYQACGEMILETLSCDGFGFYPASDAQLSEVDATCQLRFGLRPRDWLRLSLGASDLRVGQLFFTNGEKDPWHTGAIRDGKLRPGLDISQHLIPAAAHHEDLRFDSDKPRPQVSEAKRMALAAMRRWLGGSWSVAVV